MKTFVVLFLVYMSQWLVSAKNCYIRKGDQDFIQGCSCRYDKTGSYMVYNIDRPFNENVTFTSVYHSSTIRDTVCTRHGYKVLCMMPYTTGHLESLVLSAVNDGKILNQSMYKLSTPLMNCECKWNELQPKIYLDLSNSKKYLKLSWEYQVANMERHMSISSQICIKEHGKPSCKTLRCETNFNMRHECQISIEELDYNKQYDFCVISEDEGNCLKGKHTDCINKTLDSFYYKRFELNVENATCLYNQESSLLNLHWGVLDSGNPNYYKSYNFNITYSIYDSKDEKLLEDHTNKSDVKIKLKNTITNIGKAIVRLCLLHTCSQKKLITCTTKKSSTMRTNDKYLYIIIFSAISFIVLIVIVGIVLKYVISKQKSNNPPIQPIDGDVLKFSPEKTEGHKTIPIHHYEECYDITEERDFDHIDLSHTTGE